ncbi:NAD-dependent epimerase/dehydratase family protein (plasmid) [Streptomyces sp. NBC_00715]|uniref:NAD-dependent epimerase/dehydratase family protein n=1 Tax=Streptomyces sp. NBC_00715 TaxID=2975811 RepID=UPI002F9125FB
MRVLVTGGAGFIGSHTVDALLAEGHDVRVLDALVPPVHPQHRFPQHLLDRGVDCIIGDVRDRKAWERALADVDAVFHLAAYQDYLPDFSTFFNTNVVSTALLYEVLVESGLLPHRVVVASSQAVYGEGTYRCSNCPEGRQVHPRLRKEEDLARRLWDLRCTVCGQSMTPEWTDENIVAPHNAYALSKYGEENVALTLGERYNIPSVALRYSIVQGSRQSFHNAYSGILRIFTQRILGGLQPVCYEDGHQLRDYVSVHDVVRANLLALHHDGAVGQAINIGGGRQVSVADFAQLVVKCAGASLEPSAPGLYRVGDTRHVLSSIDRAASLGWRPEVPLSDIVEEYLSWAVAQPDFGDVTTAADEHMRALGTLRHAT